MGKGNSAPPAPDARQTAAAEAQFNRLDTYSPDGFGVRYGFTNPTTGEFQQGIAPANAQSAVTTVESPEQRAIREAIEPASVTFVERMVDENVADMPGPARVEDRSNIAGSIFNRNFSLMAPAIDMNQRRLINNLQARGIPVGSEAFNEAYGDQQRTTMDTLARMAMDADIASGQEQSRQFSLDASERGTALAEIAALMGGNYTPPTSAPSGAVQPVNYSGLVGSQYNADVNRGNASAAATGGIASGLGTLGAAAIMKCTMHAKEVSGPLPVGWAANTVQMMPLHVWKYRPGHAPIPGDNAEHIGPMAEHFHGMTGLGNPHTINAIDYLGLLAGALQAALNRIDMLEARVEIGSVH
ncbi:MAG: hypothetical protein AAF674_19750 [Pseudomonadota bacterium]